MKVLDQASMEDQIDIEDLVHSSLAPTLLYLYGIQAVIQVTLVQQLQNDLWCN